MAHATLGVSLAIIWDDLELCTLSLGPKYMPDFYRTSLRLYPGRARGVGVPETLDGNPSGVLVQLFSVQFSTFEVANIIL